MTTAKVTIETKTTTKRPTASPRAGEVPAERGEDETSTPELDPQQLPGALFSTPDVLK
ncbi:hypothetical protein GGQ06_002670 [Salinibacter ruber]|nr:hypothetical protein [Salinibacter ruber]